MSGPAGQSAPDARSGLIDRVAPYLDLVTAPFTAPGSRLLVLRDEGDTDGVTVRVAEYERRLDDCVVIERMRVLGPGDDALPVTTVLPDRVEFGGGAVTMVIVDGATLSFGSQLAGPWSLELHGLTGLESDARNWVPGLPSAQRVSWFVSGEGDAAFTADIAGRSLRLTASGPETTVSIAVGDEPVAPQGEHADHAARARADWQRWFDRCPRVRDDLQDMTAFCWWVLGANIVTLPGQKDARAVVPSKIGYVGLWQWDAYFIAVGLRHGDPDLAREQLELAFRFPTPDGQLPDVVHDEGVLASSDDLPPHDRDNLRRAGSSIADPSAPIPLTKPPLAAWALRKVLETAEGGAWADAAWATIGRSQEWWFAHSDLDGDGMPEYGHPYSSGLDDSPVFDGELPVASPDLAAYLIVQDDELASRAQAVGDASAAEHHSARADRTLSLLEAMWDDEAGFFRARGGGEQLDAYAVVSLLPLLTGRLPDRMVSRILAALDDPQQFATPFAVPTVAVRDADFSPERMWRGPVWININALLVEGLAASGHAERARELAESTLRLVIGGGGPHEYFNPVTGRKAATATTSFGWSAALFVDLAVRVSARASTPSERPVS